MLNMSKNVVHSDPYVVLQMLNLLNDDSITHSDKKSKYLFIISSFSLYVLLNIITCTLSFKAFAQKNKPSSPWMKDVKSISKLDILH